LDSFLEHMQTILAYAKELEAIKKSDPNTCAMQLEEMTNRIGDAEVMLTFLPNTGLAIDETLESIFYEIDTCKERELDRYHDHLGLNIPPQADDLKLQS
jgi:hypothetical protein